MASSYYQYERRSSYATEPFHAHHHHHHARPSLDSQPRPVEPRPPLTTSLSDTVGVPPHRVDAFASQLQLYKLPGVNDILSDGQSASGPAPHHPWPSTSRVQGYYQNGDSSYPRYVAAHPPMAIHPPHQTQHGPYQPLASRPLDLTFLDSRQPKHPPPSGPYPGYPDSARDFGESPNDPSTNTYRTNGVHSPYASLNPDKQYTTPTAPYDRPTSSPFGSTSGPESSKQYLGTKDIPGEGTFHFYEGGFRIPTHVDGEQVNPAWGLTKANKPRKRLALACLDCREKKIKCEPGASSCLQCEKAKRLCRRAPAQSSQTNIATSPSWADNNSSPSRKQPSISDPTPTTDRELDNEFANKRRSREDPSPPNVPSKKHRSTSPAIQSADHTRAPPKEAFHSPHHATNGTMPSAGTGLLSWEDDPYQIDAEATMHLVDLYFVHVNNAVYWLYPRDHFLHWMKTSMRKCQNERMVMYAILAAGSIFAGNEFSGFGKECARIAGDAVSSQVGKFNMAGAQTRILLAMYHFSKGARGVVGEYSGSAIRTVTYLRYNTEEGCVDSDSAKLNAGVEFRFSPEQYAECKRRTFWAAFLMDRLSGTPSCAIKPQDVFVRLPCMEDTYQNSQPSDAPYFPHEHVDTSLSTVPPNSPLAPMAWLALIAAIFGDVTDFVFRASHRPSATYRAFYEPFYADARARMHAWVSRLPSYLQYSDANLEQSIQKGYAGSFISLHTLHNLAQMKLNQCLRHAEMRDSIAHNIREAHAHAEKQIEIMSALRYIRRDLPSEPGHPPQDFLFTTAFPGTATVTAINILGAGGPESTLQPTLNLIEGGLFTLRELSSYWNSARDQLRACETRFYQVKGVLTGGQKMKSGAWLGRRWGLDLSMEEGLRAEDDCVYGLGEEWGRYFDAFGEERR